MERSHCWNVIEFSLEKDKGTSGFASHCCFPGSCDQSKQKPTGWGFWTHSSISKTEPLGDPLISDLLFSRMMQQSIFLSSTFFLASGLWSWLQRPWAPPSQCLEWVHSHMKMPNVCADISQLTPPSWPFQTRKGSEVYERVSPVGHSPSGPK